MVKLGTKTFKSEKEKMKWVRSFKKGKHSKKGKRAKKTGLCVTTGGKKGFKLAGNKRCTRGKKAMAMRRKVLKELGL